MKNGIICSADQIVLDNDDSVWKRAKDVEGSQIIQWSKNLYSFCTPNGEIILDGWRFTDFEQVMDEEVNNQIDHVVTEYRKSREERSLYTSANYVSASY